MYFHPPSLSLSLPPSLSPQLFNVVVDTEETGKQLLQRGKLKRRYTIIPLNKIASRSISGEAVKRAQALVNNIKIIIKLLITWYTYNIAMDVLCVHW